jgi:putative nucleotidyltransferase with HDIG domain
VTRFGRWYIAAVAVLGVGALTNSLYVLTQVPFNYRWLILWVLTWLSGSFAIRVPGVAATIYVSEAFFFTTILLFGPAPATVCMAIDGLLISIRRKHREAYRVIFNLAEPSISVWVAAQVFYLLSGVPPLGTLATVPSLSTLVLPVVAMAAVYFVLNSGLTAVAVTSETGASPYRLWREHFMWLSLNYFGGASVALLLALNAPRLTWSGLGVVVPLIVISWLTFKTSMDRVEDANLHLTELNRLYLSTVETLAMAIDAKDQITHGHIRRVQCYAIGLAKAIGVSDQRQIKAIEAAALLHDMGKLAVPEHILNKPGKLTPSEYDRIKLHASVGAQILSAIDFPYPVVPIVRHHHENWDGTGYPDGLKGMDIPLGARIMAVVDCYDALTSDRPYRPALSDEEALAIIDARRGTMYDPVVTDAFVRVHADIDAEVTTSGDDVSALEQLLHAQPATAVADATGTASGSRELTDTLLALSDLAGGMAGHTSVEDLAMALGFRLKQTVPCDLLVFYLRDRVSDDLVAVCASGTAADVLKGMRLRAGEGLSGWVAINRTTIMNSSGALDLAERKDLLPGPFDSALATPLVAGDHVVGVLSLYGESREAFSGEHQQVVEFAARQIGPALERALDFEQDRMASLFDQPTGLPNEKYLERVLASAAYAVRTDGPKPGILLLSVTDAGHDDPGGTDVLLRLAATARTAVRVTDLVFRTGDREVMILMADTTPEAMTAIAGRVIEATGDQAGFGRPVQIEAAFALFPAHAGTAADLPRAVRARRAAMLPADRLVSMPAPAMAPRLAC